MVEAVVPVTTAVVGVGGAVNVRAGGALGVFVWNFPRVVRGVYTELVGRRRVTLVEPRVCGRCGRVMLLRAKHVRYARVVPQPRAELALILSCPACRAEGALLDGPDAHVALRQGLTYLALTPC